jgi:hypothetical protein
MEIMSFDGLYRFCVSVSPETSNILGQSIQSTVLKSLRETAMG